MDPNVLGSRIHSDVVWQLVPKLKLGKLKETGNEVTLHTLFSWYRKLIAKKFDSIVSLDFNKDPNALFEIGERNLRRTFGGFYAMMSLTTSP